MGCFDCCNMKCPMYHHLNKNLSFCRCCSKTSSCCWSSSVILWVRCLISFGDCNTEPQSWTETRDANGNLVSSTYGSQQAGAALAYVLFFFMVVITWFIMVMCSIVMWFISACGFCCGNKSKITDPDAENCYTHNEVKDRHFTPKWHCCNECCNEVNV